MSTQTALTITGRALNIDVPKTVQPPGQRCIRDNYWCLLQRITDAKTKWHRHSYTCKDSGRTSSKHSKTTALKRRPRCEMEHALSIKELDEEICAKVLMVIKIGFLRGCQLAVWRYARGFVSNGVWAPICLIRKLETWRNGHCRWGFQILTLTFTMFCPGSAPQLCVTLQVFGVQNASFVPDEHTIVVVKSIWIVAA